MAGKTVNIYNLTDVQDRPRSIKLYRQVVVPGGRLVLPASMTQGRVEIRRLSRMMAAKDIHVGLTPPAWYLKLKQKTSKVTRTKQAQFRALPPAGKPVLPPAPSVEPLFDIEEVMDKLSTRTRVVIGKFAAYVRPEPLISMKMLKSEMLDSVRTALETGARIVPLAEGMALLEE